MKYKKLTTEQILISLDRLTRFKNTKEKYLRVFTDIILSNLSEPRYKRSELDSLKPDELRDYAVEIFNSSLEKHSKNDRINKILYEYENVVFNQDEYSNELLNNNIDYESALDCIPEECAVNLKWLKSLNSNIERRTCRRTNCLKFPIEKVLLVEGITEEILLPAFSKFLGYDFYKEGVQIIPAGGKNQVVKLYYKLSQELKLPIFLLLDKDAEENLIQIKPRLREIDKIHLVSCGEFEDLLPKSLIIKTVNKHLSNFASISENELSDDIPEAKNLENIFKEKGLHEFKKAEFAKLVRENINDASDISEEIANIVNEIKTN